MLSHKLKTALVLAAIVPQLMLAVHCSPSNSWGVPLSSCFKVYAHLKAVNPKFKMDNVGPEHSRWVANLLAFTKSQDDCPSDTIKVADLERVCKISKYDSLLGNAIADYVRNCGSIDYWNAKVSSVRDLHKMSAEATEKIFTHDLLEGYRHRHNYDLQTIDLRDEDVAEIVKQVKIVHGNDSEETIDYRAYETCKEFRSNYHGFMQSALYALSFFDASRSLLQSSNRNTRLSDMVKDEALRYEICNYIVEAGADFISQSHLVRVSMPGSTSSAPCTCSCHGEEECKGE